ncbi:RNA 2',3'-cyclic phosphodiesterase [Sporosarcina sp. HYO08]|uniref:RNA 2',3'-cyclic phosphodiesterase n=1 Tax=Sporosarcina sp. HYO08 TaxID=1759557 RepID=UPI00079B4635|nr:RNA 2',3'-cyclic phosphodiesterase [Sporosarcina sp. HYO08]KXH87071.1 hypothetical protein AU377_00375 [Sporosarcina sp. HYO08]
MQSHYFIGIKMPISIEEQVEAFRDQYQLRSHYKVIPHVEDLHITLYFLGSVNDNDLPALQQRLASIAEQHSAFTLRLNELSFFGSASGPRVVYIAADENNLLTALQKEIAQSVTKQLQLQPDNRFTPHVTIAKKKKSQDKHPVQKETMEPINIPVDAFSLFKIEPQQTPKYKAIATFTLKTKS